MTPLTVHTFRWAAGYGVKAPAHIQAACLDTGYVYTSIDQSGLGVHEGELLNSRGFPICRYLLTPCWRAVIMWCSRARSVSGDWCEL